MQQSDFKVHDISAFPKVRCEASRIYPGYGPQWRDELEALIARDEPFYLVFSAGEFDETQEDIRLRTIWLKENKDRFARVCKSIVNIEPDDAKREKLAKLSAGAEKAFGIPGFVVRSEIEAAEAGVKSL